MNYLDVLTRIKAIEAVVNDPERAHMMEDELYVDVLRTIAIGKADDPRALADAALRVDDMDFERWYA